MIQELDDLPIHPWTLGLTLPGEMDTILDAEPKRWNSRVVERCKKLANAPETQGL
ncbi:MAG: hypothetical protein ACK5OB_11800 [Pirellula sp.]